MPPLLLLNAAMVPNPGTYRYSLLTTDKAAAMLRAAATTPRRGVESYIGHQQTALTIAAISGVLVPLNRAKVIMEPGDEALVCKLAYLVENPATKGQPQPEDWEYGLLERVA